MRKDSPLTLVDTHAGAGIYRLDSDAAQTSGEALEGIARLQALSDQLAALRQCCTGTTPVEQCGIMRELEGRCTGCARYERAEAKGGKTPAAAGRG